MFILGTLLAHSSVLRAQSDSVRPLGARDGALLAGASALVLAPRLFNINERSPSCAPCNTAGLFWFDRWSVGLPNPTISKVSNGLLVAQAFATWWDLGRGSGRGDVRIAASVESLAWAVGVTEIVKALAARKRPVLYTAGAAAAAGEIDNQRSIPSSNTAAAAALATSYFLNRRGPERRAARWAVLATAATVGVLRVAAHRHFPSDVAAGAAVGVLSAVGVQIVRF
jgi:membrane-associated phospholipid phosphatase